MLDLSCAQFQYVTRGVRQARHLIELGQMRVKTARGQMHQPLVQSKGLQRGQHLVELIHYFESYLHYPAPKVYFLQPSAYIQPRRVDLAELAALPELLEILLPRHL